MPFTPAFLEFIGTTEMLVIAVVALIIFGPRKLPEIGRTVGKSLAEFKRASEDFKRTWEREVEFERIEHDLKMPSINVDARPVARGGAAGEPVPGASVPAHTPGADAETAADGAAAAATTAPPAGAQEEAAPPAPASKHDWL